MGNLNLQHTCPVCDEIFAGKKEKIYKNFYICKNCFNQMYLEKKILKDMTLDSMKDYLKYRMENKRRYVLFNCTRQVSAGKGIIKIDDNSRLWYYFIDKNDYNPPVYSFDEIENYGFTEDGIHEDVGGDTLKRTMAFMFLGALGAYFHERNKSPNSSFNVKEMTIYIVLTNKKQITIKLNPPSLLYIKFGGKRYFKYKRKANEIINLFDSIGTKHSQITFTLN